MKRLSSPKVARDLGYSALTTGFRLPAEQKSFDRVILDMSKSGIPIALVPGSAGVEVWRKGASRGGPAFTKKICRSLR